MSNSDTASSEHDPAINAPLARFAGQRPPAPKWFQAALSVEPETQWIEVDGTKLEVLVWGKRGRPGLLLLHGAGAHAHWWSHIAPHFAEHYRIAAPSWSGMGASGWRAQYSLEGYGREILAVAEQTGLFEGPTPPLTVGHSFGGVMLVPAMARYGARFRGAVLVDAYLASENRLRAPQRSTGFQVYASKADALARFRLTPLQPCDNTFVLDHIARHALTPAPVDGSDQQGWTWRFDPKLPGGISLVPMSEFLSKVQCPIAFIAGGESAYTDSLVEDFFHATAPEGSPWLNIPDSYHHVLLDQPLALISVLRALFATWARPNAMMGIN